MGGPAAPFRVEPLSGAHDRSRFVSGSGPLDRYLREQVSQDIKRRIATCFVAIDVETQDIVGFYTLTATSVALDALVPEIANKLPRYPVVPAALLGPLAVSVNCQGKGLGGTLLADALLRTARLEMGVFAMVVDAKDDAAQRFTRSTPLRCWSERNAASCYRSRPRFGFWKVEAQMSFNPL